MSAHVLSDCRELVFQLAIAPRCNSKITTFLSALLMQREKSICPGWICLTYLVTPRLLSYTLALPQ